MGKVRRYFWRPGSATSCRSTTGTTFLVILYNCLKILQLFVENTLVGVPNPITVTIHRGIDTLLSPPFYGRYIEMHVQNTCLHLLFALLNTCVHISSD